MNMNELGNDVSQQRNRPWTHRMMVNQRIYLDIRGYEKVRTMPSEQGPKVRRAKSDGYHLV